MEDNGVLEQNRARQALAWMWKELREQLMQDFLNMPEMKDKLHATERAVLEGTSAPTEAASALVRLRYGK